MSIAVSLLSNAPRQVPTTGVRASPGDAQLCLMRTTAAARNYVCAGCGYLHLRPLFVCVTADSASLATASLNGSNPSLRT